MSSVNKLQTISSLSIGVAEYFLEARESKVLMKIDYGQNNFGFEIILDGPYTEELLKEGSLIARHLLTDKAKLNLIERIRKKINQLTNN